MAGEADQSGKDDSKADEPDVDVVEDEAIDVEFEPAPPRTVDPTPPSRRGPGWMSLGVTALVAAGAGGAAGIFLDPDPAHPSGDNGEISESVSNLAEAQRNSDIRLSDLAKDLSDAEDRLQREIGALGTPSGNAEAASALETRLAELEAALESGADGEGPPTSGIPATQLDELDSRLAALENADLESDNVSPRLMNRAVIAMRERVDQLEALGKELRAGQDNRAEALATLSTRVSDIEFRLETLGGTDAEGSEATDLRSEIDAIKQALAATSSVDENRLAEYDALIAELRTSSSETTQKVEQNEESVDAALAFAMIETAASRGRPFLLPYNRLAAALPNEPALAALEPLATSGVPTLGGLSLLLEDAAAKSQDVSTAQADGPWNWVRQTFGDGVSVQRTDSPDTATTGSVAIARKALQDGDVDAAVGAIERITGPSAASFEPWLEQARQRVTLERSLDRLRLRMISAE